MEKLAGIEWAAKAWCEDDGFGDCASGVGNVTAISLPETRHSSKEQSTVTRYRGITISHPYLWP